MIPSDIAGLKLWLKADSLALSNGDPVSTWTDSSGTGNNVTAAGGARPTYTTGDSISGLPTAVFSSSNSMSGGTPVAAGTFTAFIVAKTATFQGHILSMGTFPNGWGTALNGSIRYADAYAQGAVTAVGTPTSNWEMWTWKRTASPLWSLRVDSVAQTIDGGSTLSLNSPSGTITLQEGGWVGSMAELIYYDTALSDSDRDGIETYLYDRWMVAPVVPPSPSFRINKLRPAFFKPGLAR